MSSSSCAPSVWCLRSVVLVALATSSVSMLSSCDNGVPSFPPLDIDAGIECSDDQPCEDEDDVCLSGHCYRPCSMTCGPMEACVSGVCMRGTPPDAGPVDGGPRDVGPVDAPPDSPPPDPCETAACEGATPFCRAGVCLACETSASCGGAVPICDVALGRCVAFNAGVCSPCNTNLDCRGAGGENYGDCVMRGGADEPLENVCLPTCTDMAGCPAGYRCDGTHCLPAGGASCTQQRAGIAMQACVADGDCAPIGATAANGLFSGSCQMSVCLIPCGMGTDCPASLTNCDGALGGFCQP